MRSDDTEIKYHLEQHVEVEWLVSEIRQQACSNLAEARSSSDKSSGLPRLVTSSALGLSGVSKILNYY